MYEELYQRITKPLCSISVYLDQDLISDGSGFAISNDGIVFTAAHVVTGRMPIHAQDYTDPNVKIFVKFRNMPAVEYCVGICGINIGTSSFTDNLQIDQALIIPKNQLNLPFEPFTIGLAPKLGEEIFFAGYSDELQVPFRIDRLIKPDTVDLEFGVEVRRGHNSDITGPMIKRGVVGNLLNIETVENSTNQKLQCSVFYIDNGIHSGASGGPIVNRQGQAIGVIAQRATTSASQSLDAKLAVPSGATVGLSCLNTIPVMYRQLGAAVQARLKNRV